LILTDLGTEKLTEHAQVELYSLIEFRAQNLLPILWTTQFSAEQLAAKFSSSREEVDVARARGRAAIGRLNQCSDVIQIERQFVRNAITSEPQVLSA
jgi:hypothetical protein